MATKGFQVTKVSNSVEKNHDLCGIRKEIPKQTGTFRIVGGAPISDGEFPWLVLPGFHVTETY